MKHVLSIPIIQEIALFGGSLCQEPQTEIKKDIYYITIADLLTLSSGLFLIRYRTPRI
jgi:hypothetical protein